MVTTRRAQLQNAQAMFQKKLKPAAPSLAEELIAERRAENGLTLGDRLCLALGQRLGAKVLTADRPWLKVAKPLGVSIFVYSARIEVERFSGLEVTRRLMTFVRAAQQTLQPDTEST